ncbi:MAG: hypothetical protein A2X49_05515 [Lentisphaerae bacterium GWF2_52_8]|nr:MAG: hypothetical protein A2X49_05515 [Lentisphaerae bacterium GWF2_52_8]
MQKSYPLDIESIRSLGLDAWRQSYEAPLNGREFQRIYELVAASYMAALPPKSPDSALYWAGVSQYKSINMIAQNLFCHMSLEVLRKRGVRVIIKAREMDASEAQSALSRQRSIDGYGLYKPSAKAFLLEAWRTVRTNWGVSGAWRGLLCGSYRKGAICIVGARVHKELRKYAEETGSEPICLRPFLFVQKMPRLSGAEESSLQDFAERFISGVVSREPAAREFLGEAFRAQLLSACGDVMRAYHNTFRILKKWKPGELLASPIGNLSHRVFASAWRNAGGKVTGFPHGNAPFASAPMGMQSNGSFLVLDKFVGACEGEKFLKSEALLNYKTGLESPETQMSCFRDSLYKPVFEKLQAAPGPKDASPRKVMLIGFPMDYIYYPYLIEYNTMSFLHFELSLIEALKKAGYEVIYKAHPDTMSELGNLYKDRVDRIETGRFESVYQQADCLLFPHLHSSTFGFAMMTNHPIVLMFDENMNWLHKEVRPLLEKRCAFVKAASDDKGRIGFNPEDLSAAIKRSPSVIDHEIIRRFALK